ncbi:hypothetical protein M407DRAFT_241995 [Tulasnella calospora MUT 4182]|uniref:Uncharacterized protein n=1 Tax=Tulasnella calospora MUT 4182 TaxID=1051891 RepID=A0A0C3QGT2_9AGAM|nr:hypothetical protein M407DRAFT_241995 [Tulasnella calospora MUT 4182]
MLASCHADNVKQVSLGAGCVPISSGRLDESAGMRRLREPKRWMCGRRRGKQPKSPNVP